MQHQRKPSITSTYYAISLLLVVLLLHPPPVSIRLPFFMTSALVIPSSITSISVFSSVHIKFSSPPLLSVLAYLLPPLPLFLPPGMWKHLLPVACCVDVKACVWAQEHKVLVRIHGCVQSYILAFQWKMVIRQPIKSLMARATLTKQKKRNKVLSNRKQAKQAFTQIWFHCRVLHFNLLFCFWTLVAWKQWECKIVFAQRTGRGF